MSSCQTVLLALVATFCLTSASVEEPDLVAQALQGDDQCTAGDEECALSALQLRGEKMKATTEEAHYASCAHYGCGGSYKSWHVCQCNSDCVKYGNCCDDYGDKCLSEPRAPAPLPMPMPVPITPPGMHPSPAPAPLPSGSGHAFSCKSDLSLGPVVQGHKKGIALDDDTFKGCPGQIPQHFPNTNEPIKSLRLFKAWDPEWPAGNREAAWANIASYVKANGVKVLLGTEITCNKALDKQSWEWAKGLLALLGPDHVMGLAIGNELELLSRMGNRRKIAPVTPSCVSGLWTGKYVQNKFDDIVAEFDKLGFRGVPITTVLGGYSLAGSPFVDTHDAGIGTFLRHLVATYGRRYVFTFNFYPYFDTNMHLDGNHHTCHGALGGATNWGHHGFMPGIIGAAYSRVMKMAPGNKMWLGETGWSSPLAPSLESQMKHCADWSSAKTLKKFYGNFLKWTLAKVDHVFYFTARDSEVFSVREHFGLISTCADTYCKLTLTNSLLQDQSNATVEMDMDMDMEALLGDSPAPKSRLEQAMGL